MSDQVPFSQQYREAARTAAPAVLAEWIELVRAGEDPKAYKDLADHLAKVTGVLDEGKASTLPMLNVTFVLPDGTQSPQLQVVEVVAKEVAQSTAAELAAPQGLAPSDEALRAEDQTPPPEQEALAEELTAAITLDI